ncbi:HAMP domain-containing protein [Cohnella sp. CFH 77786]|uniref:cache domain-containing sensor histidine kinase n=1 Tax=Cohnella sp. CFH 77786 TaxID=2662265 RepID=UPI001C6109FD|nr:sensor histidine kinase [Cohnella sp. CFH 77786]MBW5448564.1 HAMP domain-containing protein [Cohnella sp. CFH 77786]
MKSAIARIHRFVFELSLFNKLFYGIILIVLFVLVMSSFASYSYSRKTYEKQAIENAERLVNGFNAGFEEYLDSVDRIIMSIYADVDASGSGSGTTLKEVLSTKTYASLADEYRGLQAANAFFQRLMNLRKDFNSLYLYVSPDKQFSYSVYGANKLSYDPTSEDWYRKTVKANGSTVISGPHLPYQLKYDKPVISFSRLLKRFDTGLNQAYGVILMDFSMDSVKSIVNRADIGESTGIVLLDETGRIAYTDHGSFQAADFEPGLLTRVSREQEGKYLATVRGTKYWIAYRTIEVTGWKSMTLTPYSEIQREGNRLLLFDLALAMAALLFTVLVTYAFTMFIFKPVRALKYGIVQVRQGNFDFELQTRSQDELGLLVLSFNRMVSTIRTLIREKYEERLARQNAEFKYLQTQMNPHFMYNTLQIINGMAIVKDVPDISKVSSSLAKMLRYSLNMDQGSVTLREEIENVKWYLDIQKTRFHEYFDYEIFVEEDVYDCPVIKLILQPIVENAFVHGIEPKGENGKIRITAGRKEGILRIEVIDNGAGMGPAELERLRSAIDGSGAADGETPEGGHNRIGLKNIQNRLRLKYGPAYGLKLDSVRNEWMRVIVEIPAEPEAARV